MNRPSEFLGVALPAVAVALFLVVPAQSQQGEPPADGGNAAMPDPAQMAEMMKEYARVSSPGEHHKLLKKLEGKWDVTMKMFMGPGMPPMESAASATYEMVLDGRFLLQRLEGNAYMPDETGRFLPKPYIGMGMLGFDNNKQLYVGNWADSLGTHMLTYSGTANPTIAGFDAYGKMDEPMLGIHGRTVRYVLRLAGDDRHTFEIYDLAVSTDYKVLELVYERKK